MTLSENLKSKIDELVASDDVVLFMKGSKSFPQCGFSATVVQILGQCVDTFTTVNVLADPEIRQGIKDYSDWPTIPQLYIKGEFVGGCDIIRSMYENGDLQKHLGIEVDNSPPDIQLTDSAAGALKSALGDAEDGDVVFLAVAPNFEHDLGIGPKTDTAIDLIVSGIPMQVDRASKSRANGLIIDYVTTPQPGFRMENPNSPPRVKEIGPEELKAMLDDKKVDEFYDVRTEEERQMATLGAKLFDDEAMEALEELDKNTTIVFHCHHGGRSYNAASHFVSLGFRNVYNLTGGIDAWSVKVDPSIPRY